jgi:hypothetical protein
MVLVPVSVPVSAPVSSLYLDHKKKFSKKISKNLFFLHIPVVKICSGDIDTGASPRLAIISENFQKI